MSTEIVPRGFVNPMTTAGDLIVGGTSGVPTRKAVGSNGDVLTVVAGVPAYTALGTMAAQNANAVTITGGAVTGLTQLSVAAGVNPVAASALDLGTITNTTPAPLEISQVWNNAGLTATMLRLFATDTASDDDSLLLDLGINGSSRLRFGKGVDSTTVPLFSLNGPAGTSEKMAFTTSTGGNRGLWVYGGAANIFVSAASLGDPDGGTMIQGNGVVTRGDTGYFGWSSGTSPAGAIDTRIYRGGAAATVQLGLNDPTTPTTQTLKAHNVTTGTGADLLLKGGSGSVADGNVCFGVYTADTTMVVKGYIEIKDEAGNIRKIAIVEPPA